MPTRFKIAFSCAFDKFNQKLSQEKFKKIKITKLEDLYSQKIKDLLKEKEDVTQIFDGGDRLRFFRSGEIKSDDVIREINVILNTYNIPLFCYDFGEVKGTAKKLTDFI